MTGFRGTAVFTLVVVAVAVYAYLGVYKKDNEVKEKKEQAAKIFPFTAEQVTKLSLNIKGVKTALEKKDGHWQLLEPVQDKGDDQAVLDFLRALTGEKTSDLVAEGTFDAKTFGLDTPTLQIEMAAGTDVKMIKIGSVKAYDGSGYAQLNAPDKVYLVNGAWSNHETKLAKDFRNKDLFDASQAAFNQIEILKNGQTISALKKGEKDWALEAKFKKGPLPTSSEAVDKFLASVRGLKALGFASEAKGDADLKKIGLKKPNIAVRLHLASPKPAATNEPSAEWVELAFAEAKDKSANNVYAVGNQTKGVVEVAQSAAAALAQGPDDFLDKKFPFAFETTQAEAIHVQTSNAKFDIKKEAGVWKPADAKETKEVDSVKVNDLLSRLARLELKRLVPSGAKGLKPAKNEIVVKSAKGDTLTDLIWGDSVGEEKPGKADAKSDKSAAKSKAEKQTYVSTQKIKEAMLVGASGIEELPLKDILKAKPVPTPTPAASAAPTGKSAANE